MTDGQNPEPHILDKLSATITIRSQTHQENYCFFLPTMDLAPNQYKHHLEQAAFETLDETQMKGLPWLFTPRPIL